MAVFSPLTLICRPVMTVYCSCIVGLKKTQGLHCGRMTVPLFSGEAVGDYARVCRTFWVSLILVLITCLRLLLLVSPLHQFEITPAKVEMSPTQRCDSWLFSFLFQPCYWHMWLFVKLTYNPSSVFVNLTLKALIFFVRKLHHTVNQICPLSWMFSFFFCYPNVARV